MPVDIEELVTVFVVALFGSPLHISIIILSLPFHEKGVEKEKVFMPGYTGV